MNAEGVPGLRPRLDAVAALVPAGVAMADICTDHGRLPCWLVASGRVPRAIAVDNKEAPLANARGLVARLGLGDRVATRCADGCAGLAAGEVGTVSIAGVGGVLMTHILAGVPPGVARLVLQPNTESEAVRRWLAAAGWRIDVERLVDDGRRFEVFAAVRGEAAEPDVVDARYGALSAHLDRDALRARLLADRARLDRVARRNGPDGVAAAREVVAEALRRMEGVGPPGAGTPG